jgi:WhiB family redox-sensing transcriptional regulator
MFKPATYLDYSQALCAQTDPELFFPEGGGSTQQAKQICNACPVKNDCLMEALVNKYEDGVWGGLSARERIQLRRSKDSPLKVEVGRRKGIPNVHKRIRRSS